MDWDFQKIAAYWGGALSTLLGILKVIDFYRDRARVNVKVKGGWRAVPKNVYGDADLILISVCNKGRRPVTITKASLLMPRKFSHKYVMCFDSTTAVRPIELTEGKAHEYILNEEELHKMGKIDPAKYVAVVHDATGKAYWSHGKLKRLWRVGRIS